MSVVYAFRTIDVVLFIACSCTFFGEFHKSSAAIPPPYQTYQDDEKEFIIDQLAKIIKDQSYRMQHNLQDSYPIPLDQIDDNKQAFTYDLASHLPEINTGNQEIPFAVLPNDRRYYQSGFSNNLEPPSHGSRRFHKKLSTKSNEVQDNSSYGSSGYVTSKVTTENTSSSEVSMDLPQNTFMHVMPFSTHSRFSQDDYYFFAKAAGVGLAVLVVLLISSIACYRMQKNSKAAADIEYPAYGITGPNKDMSPTGDRRLAQSAQMYHYQHQKQQIIAMETNNTVKENRCGSVSDPDSDDDNEEGDYTVYECPGLAPAGEMEVKNPLFLDDNTPASPNAALTSKDNIPGNGVIPTVPVP
uniref:Neural proliferation differentiation and control protein 1 n=1 Tax=Schizaphis graminum TaxID=13262 RepID=A0A2S2PQJ3_SCHGA